MAFNNKVQGSVLGLLLLMLSALRSPGTWGGMDDGGHGGDL